MRADLVSLVWLSEACFRYNLPRIHSSIVRVYQLVAVCKPSLASRRVQHNVIHAVCISSKFLILGVHSYLSKKFPLAVALVVALIHSHFQFCDCCCVLGRHLDLRHEIGGGEKSGEVRGEGEESGEVRRGGEE